MVEKIKKMNSSELLELEKTVRYFEMQCESTCEKVLASGNTEELKRLEDLLNELLKFDNLITIILDEIYRRELQTFTQGGEIMSEEVQNLIDSIESFHENDKIAMLKSITDDLSAIKADFEESVNDEMTIILGEVYRQKIIDIFEILKKHGV